ncbi:MAG TPA: asparagine synthase (glutamine-hydrolyzing) [Bryobacteraceae bacterium]|nr:asparagine synthase (glutamine-hydrolyzing) [Bryobacteraceae bacterium]
MCGIAAVFGPGWNACQLDAMRAAQRHRGPDAEDSYVDSTGFAGLAHNRLSIIDLSAAGRQPIWSADGNLAIIFNGEIYNYCELRGELGGYPFHSRTDTEVLLAAYRRWGEAFLDRLTGMFAFVIWNERDRTMFAARDRFGVKPLHYSQWNGALYLASEIRALHAAGIPAELDTVSCASYLGAGLHDHSERTFWKNIHSLPPGHKMSLDAAGRVRVECWYDLAERTGVDYDTRTTAAVQEEYRSLLIDSVRLRFRSDVPVGINLSGGLDSSTLLGLVQVVDGEASRVEAFTYITDDSNYDELPWVRQMLARTEHRSIVCHLAPQETAELAESIQRHQSEPFGGLPTVAYAKLFETVRASGVVVVMDGQGMDEQWAGYDYYEAIPNGGAAPIQGTKQRTLRPECLTKEFRDLAMPYEPPRPFPDMLRNRQYWDTRYTKIPKALRFNDRISMRSSIELREPFLDHRLFELAFRQPPERKIVNGTRKWMLRRIAQDLLPDEIVTAPKRPLQTPQREWLRGPLRGWATDRIEAALGRWGGAWFNRDLVRHEWRDYCAGNSDNSFYVWQWINLGLMAQ